MHLRNIILYVAGPYSSDSVDGVTVNIKKAAEISQHLWDEGFTVICPHTNTAHFTHDKTSYEDYIEGCLCMVARCDGVVLTNTWSESEGARREKERADLLNIPTFNLNTITFDTIKGYFDNKLKIQKE